MVGGIREGAIAVRGSVHERAAICTAVCLVGAAPKAAARDALKKARVTVRVLVYAEDGTGAEDERGGRESEDEDGRRSSSARRGRVGLDNADQVRKAWTR